MVCKHNMPPGIALLLIVVIIPILLCASEDPNENIPQAAAKIGLVNVRGVESRFWGLCPHRSTHYDFTAEDRDGRTVQAYACCNLGKHCTIALR